MAEAFVLLVIFLALLGWGAWLEERRRTKVPDERKEQL